jgi:hypothetical protein
MRTDNDFTMNRHQFANAMHKFACALASLLVLLAGSARAELFDWSVGAYGGQYYDSEPAGWTQGRANYQQAAHSSGTTCIR